jgi:hypothetical protein
MKSFFSILQKEIKTCFMKKISDQNGLYRKKDKLKISKK